MSITVHSANLAPSPDAQGRRYGTIEFCGETHAIKMGANGHYYIEDSQGKWRSLRTWGRPMQARSKRRRTVE